MGILALDAVLLPSEYMMDMAIEMNKKIKSSARNEIKLDKEYCLPHITLAMGCAEEKNMKGIRGLLREIAGEFSVFNLKTIPAIEKKAWFRIEQDEKLFSLHKRIMDRLHPYFTYEADKFMFYKKKGEVINDMAVDYVKNFPLKSALENYTPHITMGSHDFEIALPEIEFSSRELALCHLGNYCTCRKILLSFNLI